MDMVFATTSWQSFLIQSCVSLGTLSIILTEHLKGVRTVHDEAHLGGLWVGLKFCFPYLGPGMESLQGFLDVSSELVVVSRGSVVDESDVHVSRFGLWRTAEVQFVEGFSIKE